MNGFRGYRFRITLETTPVVGPHIPVGKDRLVFELSPGPAVMLAKYEQLATHELPPHWKDLLRAR